jgi:hypothetical protein
VLTGTLLVASIAIDAWRRRPRGVHVSTVDEVTDVKNSQLAILCGAILLGAAITSGTRC